MNELALFAGAGGGILGGHLLGWRTVCAVEWEPYAASVLVARQNDRFLPPFPIWDDVQTFDGIPWRGIVDVVSGGFPCQDISAAGGGKELMEKDQGFGKKWQGSFVRYDHDTSSWKTHQFLLLGGLEEFLETWPKWGLMQNGGCWVLPMLAHRIKGKEFGYSLPTPMKSDGSEQQMRSKVAHLRKTKFGAKVHSMPYWAMKNHNLRLSPKINEWVMGWPMGWTDLQPLEMDRFHWWRQQHGRY